MDVKQIHFDAIISEIRDECSNIFTKKLADYGPTWLFFRDISLCDQLWIKIRRIRNIEEAGGVTAVDEGREPEFIGIINYAIIMLMKIRFPDTFPSSDSVVVNTDLVSTLDLDRALQCYQSCFSEIIDLLSKKNHDYGNAWAEMHTKSLTDQIIIKIARIRNILANHGHVQISENIDAQLMDVVNYSLFSLIRLRCEA